MNQATRWPLGFVVYMMLYQTNQYRSDGSLCWAEWPWGGVKDTTQRRVWHSPEEVLDMIAWSRIPDEFTEQQSKAFDDYWKRKIDAVECCEILGYDRVWGWFERDRVENANS